MRYSAEVFCEKDGCRFLAKGSGNTPEEAVFQTREFIRRHLMGRPHFKTFADAQVDAAMYEITAYEDARY